MSDSKLKILEIDPYLSDFEKDLKLREELYKAKRKELVGARGSLVDFADGYKYFGFHKTEKGFVYREWAPAADALFLCGDFNGWDTGSHQMTRLENGVFEIYSDALREGQKVQTVVWHEGQMLRRIPLYATRVVQDPVTYLWCAEIEDTFAKFNWTDNAFVPQKTPYIYECHIGMAQEHGGIGSYDEFTNLTLPRIKELGYNTIQIMAVMEHPYYGSFGYQVSNFFAPSSKYGKSEDL